MAANTAKRPLLALLRNIQQHQRASRLRTMMVVLTQQQRQGVTPIKIISLELWLINVL
jgi:hypothetical protein